MLLTTLENTLASSLANPALSDGNRPMYIGLGTSEVAASLSDTALSADHIVTEIDSISVSGSKTTILWKLPYENGNAIPGPIREIGVFAKNGTLLIRREFTPTEKMDRTSIYGKITVDLPILAVQNGVDSTVDLSMVLSGEIGTVVGVSSLAPGGSAYFTASFPSVNYDELTYTGTLELVEISGNGAILRMPEGATGTYTASWTASYGRSASIDVSPITQLCSDPAYYVLDGDNLYQNGWFFVVGEGISAPVIPMQPYISGYMVSGSASASATYFSGANLFFVRGAYAYEGYYYYRIFWLKSATPYPTPGCV